MTALYLLHLPIQALIALLCYRIHREPDSTRYTRLSGTIVALFASLDYFRGVTSDFQHLRALGTGDTTDYMCDLLVSYLFVNMVYRFVTATHPTQLSLLHDCAAPMALFAFVGTSKERWMATALRPLMIGIVPNVIAAFRRSEDQSYNPHLQLWFRVLMPIYSLRYMYATLYTWNGILLWITYNAAVTLMEIRNRGSL